MSANNNLERLVSRMDMGERLVLLEKIRATATVSIESPPSGTCDGERAENLVASYGAQAWFIRMLYSIIAVFAGKSALKLFMEKRMAALGKGIEKSAPGVFNYKQIQLLEGFFVSLVELKDASRFFYNMLDTSINKDRGAFYAILGSLEMGEIHRRLQRECTPQAVLEKHPELPQSAVKPVMLRTMEEILSSVPESARQTMYYHARSLNHIRDLSCFLFDRLLVAFEGTPSGHICRLNTAVKELLLALDSILFSLRETPAQVLFEALFVYDLETRATEASFDVDSEMGAILSKARAAVSAISGFNKSVPLSRIIRCASWNIEYCPTYPGGGEDWFHVYRDYWKRQTENVFDSYIADKKMEDIRSSLEASFGVRVQPIANAAYGNSNDGFPLQYTFALSFLKAFHSVLVNKVSPALKKIIESDLDEDFDSNSFKNAISKLREAQSRLLLSGEQIRVLETKMAMTGDYGRRYELAKRETDGIIVKQRKMQTVQNEAAKEAVEIVSGSYESMGKVVEALEGIVGSKNDETRAGYANFDKNMQKKNNSLTASINGIIYNLRYALQTLDDISSIDQA
jgi:hypothetical protein